MDSVSTLQRECLGRMAGTNVSMRTRSVSGECAGHSNFHPTSLPLNPLSTIALMRSGRPLRSMCSIANKSAGLCLYTVSRPVMSAPHPSTPAGGSNHCQPIILSTECLPPWRKVDLCLGPNSLNGSTSPRVLNCMRRALQRTTSIFRSAPWWCCFKPRLAGTRCLWHWSATMAWWGWRH